MPRTRAAGTESARHRPVLMAMSFFMLCFPADAGETSPGQTPPFRVRFWADGIEIAGSVPSRKAAVRLREALYWLRDCLLLWDDLQVVETNVPFPNLDALAGLIRELDLSTCAGELKISETAILVSGLTDSLVAQSAFAARLEDLTADGWEIRNEICLVAVGDLAELNPPHPDPPSAIPPTPSDDLPRPFVLYDESFGPEPLTAPRPDPDRDPLVAFLQTKDADSPAPAAATSPESASLRRLEPLSSVEFAPESFLVPAGQFAAVQEAAGAIDRLPGDALPVILTGYPDNDGEHAYNDWLGARRARAVFALLRDMGVEENRLFLGSYREGQGKRHGTVTLFVPHREPIDAAPVGESVPAAPE